MPVPQVISNHSNRYINHCCSCACVLVGDIHIQGWGTRSSGWGGGRWGDGDALLSHLLNLKYFAQSHIIIINKCTHPIHAWTYTKAYTYTHTLKHYNCTNTYSPRQSVLLSVSTYPVKQLQEKDPSVSKQVCSQLWLPAVHSSMSNNINA